MENGIEGLAHRDMLTWSSKKNSQPGNLYARSQSVDCIVLEVDYVKKRLSLGNIHIHLVFFIPHLLITQDLK